MEPKVSIILTTRNQAHSLWRTILSVMAQTEENWELIIVDRGSVDCTQKLIAEFTDPKIKILRCKEESKAAARNLGLQHARGEYIAYLGPDRGWAQDFLEQMINAADNDPHGMLWYSGEMRCIYGLDASGRRALTDVQRVPHQDYTFDDAAEMKYPPAHLWLHRRTMTELVGKWDVNTPWFADWDMFVRLMNKYPACVHWINKVLAETRVAEEVQKGGTGGVAQKARYRRLIGFRYLENKWRGRIGIRMEKAELN
ncbi:MAG: glycosyltransferase family 2 protein [Planctomycetes bacterium]|nr:glycosyltransferase family 2 protein [Planctomycetota bacterium]